MKSFQQFVEQAAAAAPAPTPSAPVQKTQRVQKSPKVTDPSTGVDIDKYGRWQGQAVNLGSITEPERTEVTPGKKGPDPNLPAGAANPNRKRDYLDGLMNKAPGTHTPAERQALLDAGYDDFVRGGKTASPVGDAAMLAATYGLVKGAGALAGRAGIGAAASRFGKGAIGGAISKGKDIFKQFKPKPKVNPRPPRYGGYNAQGKPNIPVKGEPGYRPPGTSRPSTRDSGTGPWTSSSYNPNKPGGGPARKRFPGG